MIGMGMGHEKGCLLGTSLCQMLAEHEHTRACVENDDLAIYLNRDAAGVAAILHVLRRRAGEAPSHSPKNHVNGHVNDPPFDTKCPKPLMNIPTLLQRLRDTSHRLKQIFQIRRLLFSSRRFFNNPLKNFDFDGLRRWDNDPTRESC
jgi:hypothetical protein